MYRHLPPVFVAFLSEKCMCFLRNIIRFSGRYCFLELLDKKRGAVQVQPDVGTRKPLRVLDSNF